MVKKKVKENKRVINENFDYSDQNKKPEKDKKFMNEKEIAMDFAMKVHQKFDKIVKASILFGSQANDTANSKSDIDIIIIIDDAAVSWDLELVAWYREELAKLVSSSQYPKELHVNSVKLTTWWQDLMQGDPVIINILRYGEVLIDIGGFFNPLKILLQEGKIRGTVEAVYNGLQRAPTHLARSKNAKLGSIEGIYWCMIDAAQAALIMAGKMPPSPEHIPALLKETFVDNGLISDDYVNQIKEIYLLHKKIVHNEVHEVRGAAIDQWIEKAESFLIEMTKIINSMIESSKKNK